MARTVEGEILCGLGAQFAEDVEVVNEAEGEAAH